MARGVDSAGQLATMPRFHWHVQAFAVPAIGAGLVFGLTSWSQQPYRAVGFAALMLAAILTSALAPWRTNGEDSGTMPLSFVLDFSALLFFGPLAMTFIATAGVVAEELAGPARSLLSRRALLNIATVALATLVAGFVYIAFGGTMGQFAWPWQGAPIAAAVVAYCFVTSGSADLIVPLSNGKPVARTWVKRAFRCCPMYFIGASVAVVLVELISHRAWNIAPLAAVPLYFACQAYGTLVSRRGSEHRRRDAIESLEQAISLVDNCGRVTLWNEALARLVDCPREHALGRSLGAAVPTLRETELPRAIDEALKNQTPRTLPHLRLRSAESVRILQADILPEGDGATLLWHDVTERRLADQALRRDAERFALTAEGANDGLWAWDRRTHEFYVSARWRAIVGLPPHSGSGRREDWLDRVHPDDVVPLKEALDAHLSGQTDHFLHEHRIRHEDGTYRWFLCRGVSSRGGDHRSDLIAGSLTNINEQAVAQERIRNAVSRDPLTGLGNRGEFLDRIGKALTHFTQRHSGRFAVLYLDLDRFKVINDSLGHLVGDELLIAVSRRLESCVRSTDALARLGGDEFAILLSGLGDDMQANVMALRIQDALAAPFSIGGREVFTSVSIGIACSRIEHTNSEEIMRDADTAMYHAKARGKARHELFDADMHARAIDRLGLESDLRQAVKGHALEIHYQPIVSLASAMCVGFEALVRWTRHGKAVSPADFIPIAEELGLIESLGAWVLRESCRTFTEWRRQYPAAALDCITVNVSARQLMQQGFVHLVEQTVEEAGMKPCDLRLEITETALMDNPRHAAEVLHGLRDFGVKIYLDDFGTGYSSLSHLHKLPVDALKIDRSFVRSLLLTDRPAIVESILALARTLDTGVVAEGVESEQQARELERLGCRHAQGFFFSRPLPGRAVEDLLIANRPLGRTPVQAADQAGWIRNEPEQPSSPGRAERLAQRAVPGAAAQPVSTPRPVAIV